MLVRHCLSSRFQQAFRVQRRWQSIRRINPLGIQMLSSSLHRQLFGTSGEPSYAETNVEKSKKHLRQFNLGSDESEILDDIELQLPVLEGGNLAKHFELIAQQQSQPYTALMDQLMEAKIPPKPEQWLCAKGWTKYVDLGRWTTFCSSPRLKIFQRWSITRACRLPRCTSDGVRCGNAGLWRQFRCTSGGTITRPLVRDHGCERRDFTFLLSGIPGVVLVWLTKNFVWNPPSN